MRWGGGGGGGGGGERKKNIVRLWSVEIMTARFVSAGQAATAASGGAALDVPKLFIPPSSPNFPCNSISIPGTLLKALRQVVCYDACEIN